MTFKPQKPNLHNAVYWFSLLAFALRLGVRLEAGSADFWVNGYTFFFDFAHSIATTGVIGSDGVPSAGRVPLYPVLLAALTLGHKLFWPIAIVESLLGAGTTLCAALLARDIFRGPTAGSAAILASAITAVYPYYVIHDTALQETGLFTFLTIAAVILLRKSEQSGRPISGAFAGFVLGIDVLTRVAIVPFAVLAPLWLLWRRRVGAAAVCALLLVLTVFPWVWRNYRLTGTPTLGTETGVQLWSAHNGFLFRYYPQQSRDVAADEAFQELSPADQLELSKLGSDEEAGSRWFTHRAVAYMQSHPGQTLIEGFRKIAAGFSWLPSPRRGIAGNLVHALSYGPVMLLGLWGMWMHRKHWRADTLIYLQFGTFALISAVFWAHTSHRSYLDVYWIVFAAGALAEMLARRGRQGSMFRFAAANISPDSKPASIIFKSRVRS
jgi:hypothetical protein